MDGRDDMYGIDAAILMNPKAWEASGHVETFTDPLVECKKCKHKFRWDTMAEKMEYEPPEDSDVLGPDDDILGAYWICEDCGHKNLGIETRTLSQSLLLHLDASPVRPFNMMFKTQVGATEDADSISYLRPETAGGMFVNFKNVVDAFHPKLPFGLGQIGKAFRNEIAPRDFIFRAREFEQMEIEYFVRPHEWEQSFEEWRGEVHRFNEAVGIAKDAVHEQEVADEDRAHYSKRTIDFEFDFPFGRKELYGLAYRTDFDLSAHARASGADLSYLDEGNKERIVPHVIEPSFGVDRTVLAVLASAYMEDELGGEKRVYLKLKPAVAPIRAAVFPLLKNKPELVEKARAVRALLRTTIPNVAWDDNGNIGKRYRRQDEIGTPQCITIDFDTLGLGDKSDQKDTVTVRDRDSGTQTRVAIADLTMFLKES